MPVLAPNFLAYPSSPSRHSPNHTLVLLHHAPAHSTKRLLRVAMARAPRVTHAALAIFAALALARCAAAVPDAGHPIALRGAMSTPPASVHGPGAAEVSVLNCTGVFHDVLTVLIDNPGGNAIAVEACPEVGWQRWGGVVGVRTLAYVVRRTPACVCQHVVRCCSVRCVLRSGC